jgi:hypothetical protein
MASNVSGTPLGSPGGLRAADEGPQFGQGAAGDQEPSRCRQLAVRLSHVLHIGIWTNDIVCDRLGPGIRELLRE